MTLAERRSRASGEPAHESGTGTTQTAVQWDETQLYEYALSRYDEVDRLIANTRESARALLTTLTVLLLGAVGVEAKAGVFGPERQDFLLHALAAVSVIGLALGAGIAAWVAFWGEDADSPPSPQLLVDEFAQPQGVVAIKVVKSLARAYECSKPFLDRLHARLRLSIASSGVGLLAFVALFLVIAAKYPALYHQAFGSDVPRAPASSGGAASTSPAPPATTAVAPSPPAAPGATPSPPATVSRP